MLFMNTMPLLLMYPLKLITIFIFKTVKAGGMRIVQHKTPNTERAPKDLEDCTGLTVS